MVCWALKLLPDSAPPGLSSFEPPVPSPSSLVVGSDAKFALLGLRFFPAMQYSGGGHKHLFSLSSTREWEDLSGRPQTCVESVSVRPEAAVSSCGGNDSVFTSSAIIGHGSLGDGTWRAVEEGDDVSGRFDFDFEVSRLPTSSDSVPETQEVLTLFVFPKLRLRGATGSCLLVAVGAVVLGMDGVVLVVVAAVVAFCLDVLLGWTPPGVLLLPPGPEARVRGSGELYSRTKCLWLISGRISCPHRRLLKISRVMSGQEKQKNAAYY